MRKILIVVDMQNDFVDGALGTPEAQAIIPAACAKIREFDGEIFVTMDTHFDNYLQTHEGKNLPVIHCGKNTHGWQLNDRIQEALSGKNYTAVEKSGFGAKSLPKALGEGKKEITMIGLCTDICVVSNALLLKTADPDVEEITVDSACCAGVTPHKHNAALETMRSCQIRVI